MEHTFELLKFLFIILLFAGVALFVLKKLKKRQFNRVSENGLIKIQDAVQLGLSDKLYVVTVGKERILLFVTNNGVSTEKLDNLTEEEKKSFEEMYQQTPQTVSDAFKLLRKGLKK